MQIDFYIIAIPFCVIPVLLVSIDYLKKNAEIKRRNSKVIDFDKFLRRIGEGDAVDSDIAKLLDIDKIVA